jgi:hypothetical protein
VSCGSEENKHREMLTFEVANFDTVYNCILGRPILVKFMVIIHTAYAMIKMPRPKGVITLESDLRDALVCENATLTHTGRFGEKEAQELAAKMAKMHGGSTSTRMVVPKPPAGGTPRPSAEKKSTFVGSMSNQPTADQSMDDKKKGVMDKEVSVDPNDTDKKLRLSTSSSPNRNSCLSLFSRKIWISSHDRYHICPGSLGR